jgi:hypothetical protein
VSRKRRFFHEQHLAWYHAGEVLFNPGRGSGLGGQGAREDNGPLPQLGQPLIDFLSRTRYSLEACQRNGEAEAEDLRLRSCQNCQLVTSAVRSWGRGRSVVVYLREQFTLCTSQSNSGSILYIIVLCSYTLNNGKSKYDI